MLSLKRRAIAIDRRRIALKLSGAAS